MTGTADRNQPGAITWWFEFGLTTDYGSTTTPINESINDPISVDQFVGDLTPSTTYHYRLCARDFEKEQAICGSDVVFTTEPPRDHVAGTIEAARLFPEPLRVGLRVDASTAANGTDGRGSVEFWADDFRFEGTVTCMTIVGNRTTVGYQSPEGLGSFYINDNGPTGDSFSFGGLVNPTVCPAPPAGPYDNGSNYGDIIFVNVP